MVAAPTKDEVTEHELKLIGAMRHLKIKPKNVETTDELEKFMKDYDGGTSRHQHPRLSIFYIEDGKREVGFQTWKYEILCLQEEKKISGGPNIIINKEISKG